LVEPPIACNTTCAFLNDDAVKNSLGRGPFAAAIAAATLPLASAERKRSACGAGMSGKPSSTIAFEKRWNPMLSLDREGFVNALSDVPAKPADMSAILDANRRGETP